MRKHFPSCRSAFVGKIARWLAKAPEPNVISFQPVNLATAQQITNKPINYQTNKLLNQ
jgi:hypothetical protein